MKNGYRLLRVFEYHKFEQSKNLFHDFVVESLKNKILASSVPSEFVDKLDDYAELLNKQQGIDVDPSQFVKNPTLRLIAKLAWFLLRC